MQRKESADGQREREVVRSQLRDIPSASVAHRASYCMDVLRVTSSSATFDWLFDAFGPIVWLCRRGFNRSGGGDRLQTYKKVFGNSKGLCRETPPRLSLCCVNMSTSLEKLRSRPLSQSQRGRERAKLRRRGSLRWEGSSGLWRCLDHMRTSNILTSLNITTPFY